MILNTLGYGRSYVFGAAPTWLPPSAQFTLALFLYTVSLGTGEPEKKRRPYKRQMWQAMKTFMPGYLAYKDWEAILSGKRSLESLFFYTKGGREKSTKKGRHTRRRR